MKMMQSALGTSIIFLEIDKIKWFMFNNNILLIVKTVLEQLWKTYFYAYNP